MMKKKRKGLSVIDEYINSIRSIPKILLQLIFPLLADLTFLIFFVMSHSFYSNRVISILSSLNMSLALNAKGLFESFMQRMPIMQMLDMFPDIKTATFQFLGLSIALTIITIMIYITLQAVSWKVCFDLAGKKIEFKKFFGRFFMINLFWGGIVIIHNIMSLLYSFMLIIVNKDEPIFITIISKIAVILVFYLAFISYTRLSHKGTWKRIKDTFRIGFTRITYLGSAFLIFVLTIVIINSLVDLIPLDALRLILEILVILPMISVMRIYFIKVSSSLK